MFIKLYFGVGGNEHSQFINKRRSKVNVWNEMQHAALQLNKIKNDLFNLHGFIELAGYVEQNSNSPDRF